MSADSFFSAMNGECILQSYSIRCAARHQLYLYSDNVDQNQVVVAESGGNGQWGGWMNNGFNIPGIN